MILIMIIIVLVIGILFICPEYGDDFEDVSY